MAKAESYVLTWQENEVPTLGEGLSRTTHSAAKLWSVDVELSNSKPMRTTVRAISKSEAKKFTVNRYPAATSITVRGLYK